MGPLYWHRLRDHFLSLRVQLSLLVVLAFFVLNGLTYSWRILDMHRADVALYADVARSFDAVHTVADAAAGTYRALNQPTGTEFMTEGGFNWFWGTAWVTPQMNQFPFFYYARDVNLWMDRFEVLDWTLIVKLVFSFLCIVIAYDGISGELERGTLRLVLANPISRGTVLMARFSADLTILLVAFGIGALTSLLILTLSGAVPLTWALLLRCALYSIGAAVYASLFLLLCLGVSAVARSSVTSVVLLTVAWAVLVVVVPSTSYLIAVKASDLTDRWADEVWEYQRTTGEALASEDLLPRAPQVAAADGYAVERRLALRLQEADREGTRIGVRNLQRQASRYGLARAINLISPAFAFQHTVEGLLGTGATKRQHFLAQVFEYREAVRTAIRDRDAADGDSPHVLFMKDFVSQQPMSGADLPRFRERPLSPAAGLAFSVLPLVILVCETGLAFGFALWAVNRMDLTGFGVSEAA